MQSSIWCRLSEFYAVHKSQVDKILWFLGGFISAIILRA